MKGSEGCWDMQKKGQCPRSNCKWCAGLGRSGGCGGGAWKGKSGGIVIPGHNAGGGMVWAPACGKGIWKPAQKKGRANNRSGGSSANRSKLSKISPWLKVWIGNIPKSVTREALKVHMGQAGMVRSVDLDRGSGGAEYGTEAEVATAIALLHGSFLEGAQLQLDVWKTKKLPVM
eukprot:TRINITY_DN54888_c0_g1_i1.p1 TRINITY_DN54888_c0_g1~~TRINITY_DN54888_c0_g1_i1.p1  ORF type:complete len:203 (+),score=21.12 TRINITY_DN54888_c0_g1_i1:89-610(+)